jgi:DNA-binding HxlR family transcriptional regulator
MTQIYPPDRRIDMCRRLVAMRRTIGEAIGYRLCPSPVWDMLLDLYLAQYEKREVYLFSLYTAAPDIPQSTAHRKIAEMEKRGLVTRDIPRPDGRRVAISMTAQGLAIVDRLLDRIIELWEGWKS